MKHSTRARHLPQYIAVRDAQGALLYRGRLDALPIPEAVILSMSLEFFNDPAPCFIHQGAVKARAYAEIERALVSGQFLPIPQVIRRYFGDPQAAEAALEEGS